MPTAMIGEIGPLTLMLNVCPLLPSALNQPCHNPQHALIFQNAVDVDYSFQKSCVSMPLCFSAVFLSFS